MKSHFIALFFLTLISFMPFSQAVQFKFNTASACQTLDIEAKYISIFVTDTLGNFTISLTAIKNSLKDVQSNLVQVFENPDVSFEYELYNYKTLIDTFYFRFISDYSNNKNHLWWIDQILTHNNKIGYNLVKDKDYIVAHKVTANGCPNSTTKLISILEQEVKFSKIFTPKNDLFYIKPGGISEYSFIVNNQHGSKIFQQIGKKNISWDGSFYRGEVVESTNYYCVLKKNSIKLKKELFV